MGYYSERSLDMIHYGKQLIERDDIDQVLSVLKSDFLTQGPQIPLFEGELARYVGSNFSVATNSATSALHIACLALGVGKGDILWTVPNSFVASANCGLYCGAEIDFVDIDPITLNMSVHSLAEKLRNAKERNQLPKVIVPVHFSGSPCDMKKINQLTQKYGVKIIEDASHALGAEYRQKKVGNCEYSDITVFSFHPVKIITTGEGGMATTNNENLFQRMQMFRSHGVTRTFENGSDNLNSPWYYEQKLLGYNYRITDIQAALGRTQLRKVDKFVASRKKIADRYISSFHKFDLTLPTVLSNEKSSWHLFPIQLNGCKNINNKIGVYEDFLTKGIRLNVHYIPIHTQPYYKSLGFKEGDFPVSESYYQRAFSLPIFPSMTDHEQLLVIEAVGEILN